MGEKVLFISATTFGQLFNFFVTLASIIVSVNCFFDIEYRIREMTMFEDNIGIVVDIISGIAALTVAYYSIITPYDETEIVTTADENFRTVLYMICLHMAGQAEVVDDPAIVFSGVFKQATNLGDVIEENIDKTLFNPEDTNPTFFQSFDFELIESLTTLYLEAIYVSKIWLTIAGIVYSAYVVRAHYPSFGYECCRIFTYTLLGRLPSLLATLFALTMYFYNYNVDTVQRFANAVWSETKELNADLPAVTVFETLGVVALGFKLLYIFIFWDRYDFSLIGTTFLLGKAIVKADLQLREDEYFDSLVYVFIFMSSMSVGPLFLNLTTFKVDEVAFFIPKVLYKVGLLMMMLSFVFILSSYTVDWFNFDFDKIQIGTDIIAKIDAITQRIDDVNDQLFDVVMQINPCVRRNPNFPNEIVTDDATHNLIGTTAQIEENLKNERIKMHGRNDDGSLCIDKGNNFAFFNPLPGGNTCAKLKADQDDMRTRMQQDGIDATSFEETEYKENDYENDKFIENAGCKHAQCAIMTGVAAAAIIISAIPFAGYAGVMMNLGQRAAFTIFKLGRKIAKFGPRIKKKKDKFKKLAKTIRRAGTNSEGKLRFTAAMAGIYLPAFICIVVAFTVIMFRRDIYLSRNKTGDYTVLKNDKRRGLQSSFRVLLTIFFPMLIVNAAFTAMIWVVPEFLFEVLELITSSNIVIARGEERPGYTALKMTYLFTTLGSACVVVSGLMFLFAGSFVLFWNTVKQYMMVGKRREITETQYPNGISSFWYSFYWVADKFLNINTQYLQPLIFSLPVLIIVFDAFINDKDYFSIRYGVGPDMADLQDNLGEGIANRERSEGVSQELDNQFCGIVGELVAAIASAALGTVTTLMAGFASDIEEAFEGLKQFTDSLDGLNLLGFIKLDIKGINFMGSFLLNCLIYGIPIGCTAVLIGAWLMSQFYLPDKNTLLYLSSGIFIASVANLMIHSSVGTIFQLFADFKMPLFQLNLVMERDYFNTQICSVLNIASVIVTLLNYVIPIPQFSFDGMREEKTQAMTVEYTPYKKDKSSMKTDSKYAF